MERGHQQICAVSHKSQWSIEVVEEQADRFWEASNCSEQQKSKVIAKSCPGSEWSGNNLAQEMTWCAGNTRGETISALHGELWALGVFHSQKKCWNYTHWIPENLISVPSRKKIMKQQQQQKSLELLRKKIKKINQARGCWCKNPFVWSHLEYWGQLWSCQHKNAASLISSTSWRPLGYLWFSLLSKIPRWNKDP